MLEEWIRNLPITELKTIVGDSKVQGSRIWQLAIMEIRSRETQNGLAA